jgi:hypothetical protein
MPEVCTPPYTYKDLYDETYEAFGPEHTLADIARWIMQNRSDAEEIHRMLGDMLEEDPKLYVDQDGARPSTRTTMTLSGTPASSETRSPSRRRT